MPRTLWALVATAALAATGCGSGGASSYSQKNDPENLKGLFEAIAKAAAAGETRKAAALTRGVVPDREALKKVVRDDAPPAVVDGTIESLGQLPADDAVARLLAPPGRTVVTVHGA